MMKKIVTWVVVANGQYARILANEGAGKGLELVPGGELEGDDRQGRDIDADRPGRTFDSAGQGRHAKEPSSDPRQVLEEEFLRRVLEHVASAANRNAFDRLVLVAEPKALGFMRKHLTTPLKQKLLADMPKDLTKIATRDLAGPLGPVLRV